ncbi:MAG: hypothetical protein RLZZ70_752 [Candidatus Parcubacteria bacterium]|jgi:glycosyltransferase involved in cell wall biosynthesis
MKTVAFVGAHDLMVPYINSLTPTHHVVVYENGTFNVPLADAVTMRPLPKKVFGLQNFFKGETSLPWYMTGLGKSLQSDKPDDIIVLDFIRLWYLQVLWFRVWHKNTNVHLYSESKRIPPTLTSKIAFFVFVAILICTQKLVKNFFVFTEQGILFTKRLGITIPTILLPAPVDVGNFQPASNKKYLNDGILHILINARYVEYKRHEDVFRACQMCKDTGMKISLTCIGRGNQDGLSYIQNLAKKYGVLELTTFRDPVDRQTIPRLYDTIDLLVLASDNEAIGMVVPEAMACGVPTVTSDTVGANTYVLPGKTGLIFKTKNVNELANAIKHFYSKAILERAGIEARNHIESLFTTDNLKNIILDKISK